jgi:hypothetical protein
MFHSGGKQMISRILFGMLAAVSLCLGQEGDSAEGTAQPPATIHMDSAFANKSQTDVVQAVAVPFSGLGRMSDLKSTRNMLFAIDEGQVVQGVYNMDTTSAGNAKPYLVMNKLWQQRMVMYLTQDFVFRERLRFLASIECDLRFSIYPVRQYPATLMPEFYFFPNDVEINYSLGDISKPWLKIALGYFPFKYNEDAKDLGEYLLRSQAYPTIIATDFEFPMTRELGLHLSGIAGNQEIDLLGWDLMLTSETHTYPLLDGTLTGIVSNRLFNFFEVGAGVSFQRLIPVDDANTTPKVRNAVPPDGNMFFEQNGDTSRYTFSATKLMGRASINPLRFIPEFRIPPYWIFGKNPFFGKEDLKIYGEVGVLGYKDYVAYDSIPDSLGVKHSQKVPDSLNYYNNIRDRMPVMVGINLPTNPLISYGILPFLLTKWLKDETGSDIRSLQWVTLVAGLASGAAEQFFGWDCRLDVLSMEFEWFSQRFPNSDYFVRDPQYNIPIPMSNIGRVTADFGRFETSKYALYFKKSFMKNHFALSGLVGRDHMKPTEQTPPSYQQTDDFLQTKAHWWWTLRLSANF